MEAVYNKFEVQFTSEDFDGSEYVEVDNFELEHPMSGEEIARRAFSYTDDPTVYMTRVYTEAGKVGECHIDEALIDIAPEAIYDGATEAATAVRDLLEEGWFGRGRIAGVIDFDGVGHFRRVYTKQIGNMTLKEVNAREWLAAHEAELDRVPV